MTRTTGDEHPRGLLDTNILVLRHRIATAELPLEAAISAVTLAELSAGPHLVRRGAPDEEDERARRSDVLQRAENEFDALPFDSDAARAYGRVQAAVAARGRISRRRAADLMIAATAVSVGLPLYTTDPGDYAGLDDLVTLVAVNRPPG